MRVLNLLRRPGAAWVLLMTAAASAFIYLNWFALAFPLLSYFEQPLLDLGKLTNREPAGAVGFFVPFAALFILYAIGYRALPSALSHKRWAAWVVVGATLVFLWTLLLTFPIGAIDIYDYSMHTRILAHYGVSPLAHVAAEFPDDPWLKYVAWPTTPSPYGPLWQALAAFAYRLVNGDLLGMLLAFKFLSGISLLANAALAALIVRRIRPAAQWTAFFFIAWNPLLLFETAVNGHNDALMLTFILIGIALFQRRRLTMTAVAMVLAALIKMPALVVLPVAGIAVFHLLPGWRMRISWVLRTGTGCALLAAGLYAPLGYEGTLKALGAHNELFTSSLPAIAYLLLKYYVEDMDARSLVQIGSLGVCAVLVVWRSLHSRPNQEAPANDIFDVLLLVLGFATYWFQPWYTLWIALLGPLVSPRRRMFSAVLTWSVLGIYFVFDFWLWWDIAFFTQDGGLPLNVAAVLLAFGLPGILLWWFGIQRRRLSLEPARAGAPANRPPALTRMD